jgi:6-phosphogluconolactonase (cycloisomerase 2 family)
MSPRRLHGSWALLLTLLFAHATTDGAVAERTVYFADPAADVIAQFDVAPGGALSALEPRDAPAANPRRLAMTPGGTDLYGAADGAVLQYDVADDGRLTAKSPAFVAIDGDGHSIAVHPDGRSAYVTERPNGRVLQFGVGDGGRLEAMDPVGELAGEGPTGIAVAPDGRTAYVLVRGGIAVLGVADAGRLTRRPDGVPIPSASLEDIALTPDGLNLYITAGDGRVFQFDIAADGTPHPKTPSAVSVEEGAKPVGIAVTPDGSAAYVATTGWAAGGARHVFSFAVEPDGQLTPGETAHAGDKPFKLSYLSASPDGRHLFVAGGDGHLFDLGPGASLTPSEPLSVELAAATGVVVSPNQAPVASFTFTQATAGMPVQFDGSSTVDVDGEVVRYDWDFGDGHTALDAGPTPSHTYTAPGKYVVTLVVTDNEGASTTTIFTGGTVLGHGTPGAETTREIEVLPAPIPVAPAQEPVPDLGETLVAEPTAGSVRVRVRGGRRFRPLSSIKELPLGSTLDTRRGRVNVSTIRDRRNRVQEGVFFSGVFTVRQRESQRYVTELVLRGKIGPCARARAEGRAQSSARSRRRLWGSGRGRYRSRGNNSSATVRGTVWLTEDRCDGTLTRVRRGRVVVRDFGLRRKVVLTRGESYLAAAR